MWRWSAEAAVTKYHRLGSLNNFFLIVLEAEMAANSVSGASFLPDLQMVTFCLFSHNFSSEHRAGGVGRGLWCLLPW